MILKDLANCKTTKGTTIIISTQHIFNNFQALLIAYGSKMTTCSRTRTDMQG
jgi:hypothetical protein